MWVENCRGIQFWGGVAHYYSNKRTNSGVQMDLAENEIKDVLAPMTECALVYHRGHLDE